MKTFEIRDKCDGFAGQHRFKSSQAGSGGELMLMGCSSDLMRLHSGDAFTRSRWPGALEFQGPGPNAAQALSSRQSRGFGWGFWNLGSSPSTVPRSRLRSTQQVMYQLD